jgi:hypothetical protein
MAAIDPVTPEPRRFSIRLPRPLWIGLATALLVVVAVGLQLGIPIYRQEVAIREIERRGGSVESYDPVPTWVIRIWLMWSESYSEKSDRLFFQDVHDVDLDGADADDAVLDWVGEFPHVRRLDLTMTHVTDAGMRRLGRLAHLETLLLSGTGVTDAGLVHMKSLKSLRNFYVVGTGISHEGINTLTAALPGLKIIR